ncbi:MAG: HDIG domain-containing protein [Clostridia bacterium]|nr:HDIG domain-containing protein [Clostridia bacterium]
MRLPARLPKAASVLLLILLTLGASAAMYLRAQPIHYDFSIGEASRYDIVAQRTIVNQTATEEAAGNALAAVEDVWVRSESISRDSLTDLEAVMAAVAEVRSSIGDVDPQTGLPTPAAALAGSLVQQVGQRIGASLDAAAALRLVSVTDDSFLSIRNNATAIAGLITTLMTDRVRLDAEIATRTGELVNRATYFKEDLDLAGVLLSLCLQPNAVLDQTATENAREAARQAAIDNPILIERGTYVIRKGEPVTAEVYRQLSDLGLLRDGGIDFPLFLGVLLQLLAVVAVGYVYIRNYAREQMAPVSNRLTFFLAVAVPFLVSVYVTRLSPLAPPTYFAAVVLCVYFGLRMSIVMSTLLTFAILPMTGYDVRTILASLTGCFVAALFARGIARRDNYAYIIISTVLACLFSVVGYGVIFRVGWDAIVTDITFSTLSGALSVIAAIGLLPVFEMLLNTISPMRLIELSQTGSVLLRRLFVEAPGTSQHSMMVANLAETAAEAIGANALLARVGAYYHDIGKLDNPHMFTENQQGGNPHDQLPAVQSSAIITAHPENGVRIGRRYRLPPEILKIIHEHHGSTVQTYFYHKARKECADAGYPEPSAADFRYRCPVPTTRESALVMLADSVEAAVKSTETVELRGAETLIRRIVKDKNDQDQLISSGLSFQDVETIIKSFLQVYAGHFHERVKYPDERTIRKPTAKVSR